MPSSPVTLRPTHLADLAWFFQFQLDPVAAYLAAFTPPQPLDEAAYVAKYSAFLRDPTIHMQTILLAGTLVGSIAKFEVAGEAGLTYWLDRAYWGQGVATSALRQFLRLEPTRPLVARVAWDNVGSQHVLAQNGFVQIGTDTGFASARQAQIEERIYHLS
ncbi:N-acetyltransferase [Hymenobacter sp. UV11]|uniref:GNAT family N-acetyltransferase n=1 Tax=Hymenobacter sp. UV11 TaxID=1849735 RepID=UPI00105E4F4A|nr:GNAT family N-acetyltransferase [Hymenobacter sp. UV11]TDN40287.1 GCN5 family acetyltransferase [Hymenobacter sp. UV11]TFZ62578.1 N-acetyltransferase [Hymenobacter sp. UV11]